MVAAWLDPDVRLPDPAASKQQIIINKNIVCAQQSLSYEIK